MITDRTGQQEILLPINHNQFNFRKKQIDPEQISSLDTMSLVKNFSFHRFHLFDYLDHLNQFSFLVNFVHVSRLN